MFEPFDDAPCPNCGHRRTPYMMSVRHNDKTLTDIWNGVEGGEALYWIARLGAIILPFIIVLGILQTLHI